MNKKCDLRIKCPQQQNNKYVKTSWSSLIDIQELWIVCDECEPAKHRNVTADS